MSDGAWSLQSTSCDVGQTSACSIQSPPWSLSFSLQTHPPAFGYTQIYSLVVFTLHQLEGERKGIFLYMNCLGDFLQLL